MTTETRTFFIAETSFDLLAQKFAKLVKRATKLGVQAPSYEIVGEHIEYRVIRRDGAGWSKTKPTQDQEGDGTCRIVKHIELREVEQVKMAGWSFLATLDHELGEDNTVIRVVPGAELPADYRHRGNHCDHCHRAATRKATYVVRHELGDLAQVGSTCIKDFLGHDAGKVLAQVDIYGSVMETMTSAEEEFGFGARNPTTFDLQTYLSWVAKVIREEGWVSRKEAYGTGRSSTADRALADLLAYGKGM